jgi:hypothetical protein
VCERCYYTYKELDRLRRHEINAAIKSKKSEVEDLKHSEDSQYLYDRMNEMNKFVDQRVTTYRLAQSKNPRKEEVQEVKHSTSRAGAPKGVLPPLPWQLRQAEKIEEYQQQGSSFIRNIETKAHQLKLVAQRKANFEPEETQNGIDLDPNYDWKKQIFSNYPESSINPEPIKSKSAGHKPKRKKVGNIPRKFDHERLLHPHQRYLEQMKRQNLEGENNDQRSLQSISSSSSLSNLSFHHSPTRRSYSSSLLPVMESVNEIPHCSLPPLAPKKKSEMGVSNHTELISKNSPMNSLSAESESDEDDDCIGWSPFVISSN